MSAVRWARMLVALGHRVSFDEGEADVLMALHAKKSAQLVERFAKSGRPIVVVLTGTDLYRDLPANAAARRSLALAERIVVLQPKALERLAPAERVKARVILQSAEPLRRAPAPRARSFDVCVLGHLRPVKDPLRAALAARRLPPSSRIAVLQAGAALSEALRHRAEQEMRVNARYRWLGELSQAAARRLLARSRLMVLSSRIEGGSNVVSEAITSGTPILASRIDGTVGQLGESYPGYFEVGDTPALAELLARAERDAAFLRRLSSRCARLAPRFSPERERAALERLLAEL